MMCVNVQVKTVDSPSKLEQLNLPDVKVPRGYVCSNEQDLLVSSGRAHVASGDSCGAYLYCDVLGLLVMLWAREARTILGLDSVFYCLPCARPCRLAHGATHGAIINP